MQKINVYILHLFGCFHSSYFCIGKNETNVIFFTYYKGKHWKTDGISNVVYESEERRISFSLESLGPVTLIQDTHIHMPYQSWELSPLNGDKVLLTVTTVFTEIQIQIKVNHCCSESYPRGKAL